MNDMRPIVSVCMITYNHEKYIAQAIDSVLMQKTNFDYEIVIGEDCSTDKTREIVLEYKAKHPDKIKLLLREKNVGIHQNFTETIFACTGKYIALLEGDDYWIDENKLQRQVNFLEVNRDYVLVYEPAKEINEITGTEKITNKNDKDITGIEELLERGWFIRTGSIMFRNNLISEFPEWYFKFNSTDYMLHILIAQYGKIKKLDFVSSVYRRHPGGITNEFDKRLINHHYETITLLKILDKYFNFCYSKYINKHIRNLYSNILIISLSRKLHISFKEFKYLLPRMDKKMFFKRAYNYVKKQLFSYNN